MSKTDLSERVAPLGVVPNEFLTEAAEQEGEVTTPTFCWDFSPRVATNTSCTLGDLCINFS